MNADHGAAVFSHKAPSALSGALLMVGLLASLCIGATPAAAQDQSTVHIYRGDPSQDGFDGVLGGGWRNQRRYGYQGPAGVYSCAQGRVDTYLARKACGGAKFPNRFF